MRKVITAFALVLAAASANAASGPNTASTSFPVSITIKEPPSIQDQLPDMLKYLEANHRAPEAAAKKDDARKMMRELVLNPPAGGARLEISRMLVAYGTDRFGLRDEKAAIALLQEASEKNLPYVDLALGMTYLTGQLGVPVNLVKALEYVNKDSAPRSAMAYSLKAMILSDESSRETFNLDEAISAARVAHMLDKDDAHAVGLLGGLLMSKKTDPESLKEGEDLLEAWVTERKAKGAQPS